MAEHGRRHDQITLGGGAGANPTDRGERGVKRSLLTEAAGVPVGLALEGANRHDMKLVRVYGGQHCGGPAGAQHGSTPRDVPGQKPAPYLIRGLLLRRGAPHRGGFGFTAHIRSRGEEAQAIRREAGFKARRCVVERTHSWLNRFRRIPVRWDKSPENYIAFLHSACALITLRAAGLLG